MLCWCDCPGDSQLAAAAWAWQREDGDLVLPALDPGAELVPLVVFDVDEVTATRGPQR
jgi:hypothetical protein